MVVDENDDKDDTDDDSMIATDGVGRMTEKMRMMWLMGQIQNSIQGPPLNVMMQPLFQGVLK